MDLIVKLHVNLPSHQNQIRKSRSFSSVLVAPSADANRSALVSEADDDGRYLVTTFLVRPKLVDDHGIFCLSNHGGIPTDEEYRLYSWDGVVEWVAAFLNGADVDELCEIASKSSAHRSDLESFHVPPHLRSWSDIVA